MNVAVFFRGVSGNDVNTWLIILDREQADISKNYVGIIDSTISVDNFVEWMGIGGLSDWYADEILHE